MKDFKRAIAEHPFLRALAPEQLEILAEGAKELMFNPDEVIFREGEPANRFYLILSGQIALEAHEPASGTAVLQHLGEGDVMGWSWLVPPFVWGCEARATEPTRAIVLNGAHILVAAEGNREFGYELMKRVAQLVIQRLQATRKQLLRQQMASSLKE
jgi:CRP/FNR family transcriptional regulator, cyclic AMP receptor protein